MPLAQRILSTTTLGLLLCTLAVFGVQPVQAGHGGGLHIDAATWTPDGNGGGTLDANGRGDKPKRGGGDVVIFDADLDPDFEQVPAASLGLAIISNNGNWDYTGSTCADNIYAAQDDVVTASFPVSGPGCGGGATNTPPTANDDPGSNVLVSNSITIAVLANDSDAEDGTPPDPAKVTVTIVIEPLQGIASVNDADGTITYTNTAGLAGTDFITYRLTDSGDPDGQLLFDEALVSISINELPTPGELPNQTDFKIMMNYELGMHCTGFEFAYCCVLPAYNSILAQVVKPGTATQEGYPRLLEGDPNENVASILLGGNGDVLGRETVLRDRDLDGNGEFQKYVMRYWHEAQPREGVGINGNVQNSNRKISNVELNSLLSWNTVADAADTVNGKFKISGSPVHLDDPDCTPNVPPEGEDPTCTNTYPLYNGAKGVVLGNGFYGDRDDVFSTGAAGAVVDTPIDNYQNAVWNHLYVYDVSAAGVEGQRRCVADKTEMCFTDDDCSAGKCGYSGEDKKVRLGLNLGYPTNFGPGGHAMEGLLTFSGEHGTVVYTQMKVLENLPITLTSPRIWEALGLPLTPFEDSINFFLDPGKIDEDLIRPYVEMKAQLFHAECDGAGTCTGGINLPVMDADDNPVIGFGTAPIDIPNCERCHSVLATPNSPNPGCSIVVDPTSDSCLVLEEMAFWNAYYEIDPGDSDWYSRLKGAAISILARHDTEHGTDFTAFYPGADCTDVTNCQGSMVIKPGNPGLANPHPQNTRLGHESVICQKCHADNVIAVVKSTFCGPDSDCETTAADQLFENITGNDPLTGEGHLILPLTEALHHNHRSVSEGGQIAFNDSKGRNGGCQGCHPAHRSDGNMARYPIDTDGNNEYALEDNRDANGGCFVGRDVHSNPMKDMDGAETPEYLNAMGQWLSVNVYDDNQSVNGGIWCTNCHQQLGQELWKAENVADLVNAVPGQVGHVRQPAELTGDAEADLNVVLAGLGIDENLGRSWLDPKGRPSDDPNQEIASADGVDHTHDIWKPDPGMCNHAASLLGLGDASSYQDGNVATIEINMSSGEQCTTGIGLAGPDCFGTGSPSFYICGTLDPDGDVNVALKTFCTTKDCVAAEQSKLDGGVTYEDPENPSPGTIIIDGAGQIAVPVPMSAATDGRDHWLAPGEPHCADCHAAPYVEQSGNINAFAPFNYPRKASLMRYSRGHQDITCQGCHESIHGLYPVTYDIDTTSYAQAASLNPKDKDGNDQHGPLKCGTCHTVVNDPNDPLYEVPTWFTLASGSGVPFNGPGADDDGVVSSYDEAVTWMHTYTEEANPLETTCLNCHGVKGNDWDTVNSGNVKWFRHKKPAKNGPYVPTKSNNRIDRGAMDAVEKVRTAGVLIADGGICPTVEGGCVFGDPDPDNDGETVWNGADADNPGEDPLTSVCYGCHTGNNNNNVDKLANDGCGSLEWKIHLAQGRVNEKVWEMVSDEVIGDTCGW